MLPRKASLGVIRPGNPSSNINIKSTQNAPELKLSQEDHRSTNPFSLRSKSKNQQSSKEMLIQPARGLIKKQNINIINHYGLDSKYMDIEKVKWNKSSDRTIFGQTKKSGEHFGSD